MKKLFSSLFIVMMIALAFAAIASAAEVYAPVDGLYNIEYAIDLKESLPDDLKNKFRLYTYDALPRMNVIVIDTDIILQYYANKVAGMSNPCFLIKKKDISPLYDFCLNTYNSIKEISKEI